MIKKGFTNCVYYEIVSKCNLSCVHCNDVFHAPSSELPTVELLKFHKSLAPLGITNSILTGGEPTLHSDLESMVKGLCDCGKVTLTTNAVKFSAENAINLLQKYPNFKIQVSLDGITKETFETIRGKNTFEPVMQFVEEICKNNLSSRLGLSMVLMTPNINEAEKLIVFAEQKKISYVHFPQLIPAGHIISNWEQFAPPIDEAVAVEHALLKVRKLSPPRVSVNRVGRLQGWLLFKNQADCMSMRALKVSADGTIFPCPAAGNRDWTLGTISQPRLDELRFEEIGAFARSGDSKCKEDCSKQRSCETCWLLGTPNPKIIEYEEAVKNKHLEIFNNFVNRMKERNKR